MQRIGVGLLFIESLTLLLLDSMLRRIPLMLACVAARGRLALGFSPRFKACQNEKSIPKRATRGDMRLVTTPKVDPVR
jgi:hypothetical protein